MGQPPLVPLIQNTIVLPHSFNLFKAFDTGDHSLFMQTASHWFHDYLNY